MRATQLSYRRNGNQSSPANWNFLLAPPTIIPELRVLSLPLVPLAMLLIAKKQTSNKQQLQQQRQQKQCTCASWECLLFYFHFFFFWVFTFRTRRLTDTRNKFPKKVGLKLNRDSQQQSKTATASENFVWATRRMRHVDKRFVTTRIIVVDSDKIYNYTALKIHTHTHTAAKRGAACEVVEKGVFLWCCCLLKQLLLYPVNCALI